MRILSVNCTNGGSYNTFTDTFTAPEVSQNTTSVCTALARDTANNQASATLTVTITPPPADTSAPDVSFSLETLTVVSGRTSGESILLAEDDRDGILVPTVSCTNGGSFNVSTDVFTAAVVTENTESVCTAVATDAAGNESTATLTVTMTPAPATSEVVVSGKLTYDRVPFNTATNGLNYDGTVRLPIRQVPVQLVSSTGAVLQSTVSDDSGDYSFTIESGQDVRVRARSEVQKGAPNEINLKIVDNTSSDALYALQGALAEVPATNQTRNLHAASGWNGTSYASTRAAAPFALLDTIYGTLEEFIAIDADVDFPRFDVQWSTRNRAEAGNVDTGQISTSSFTLENRGTATNPNLVPVIRILGDENNDTDEYDVHVVVHEFGHYFENQLSRSDSIGGQHSASDRLDARVAFGEGWGNALSGMILDDSFYRDSFGAAQARGFDINVENNSYASAGWYSEGSVQSILYDLFDSVNDGADTASYGLGPIYGAFVDPDYKDTAAFTSIFAFLEALENQTGITASEITAITAAQNITGTTGFGVGETNNGGITDALPVYLTVPTNGTAVNFCSRNNFGLYNKHGNRRYLRVDIPTAGSYRFTMNQTAAEDNPTDGDPNFFVFKDGVPIRQVINNVLQGGSGAARQEIGVLSLSAGTHVIDANAFRNARFDATEAGSGDICYTFAAEAQ